MTSTLLQNALLLGALAVIVGFGIILIGRFRRDMAETGCPTTTEILDEFREAHARGEIDDAEFKRIEAALRRRSKAGRAPDLEWDFPVTKPAEPAQPVDSLRRKADDKGAKSDTPGST